MLAPTEKFNPELPEQPIFNYAHRREANMPWQTLDIQWNMHMVQGMEDILGGVASVHVKWWWVEPAVDIDPRLKVFLAGWKMRMDGYWEGIEAVLRRN